MRNRITPGQGRLPSAMALLVAILLAGCATKANKGPAGPPPEAENDGSSFEKAIIINAPNEAMGVNDEYTYLGEQFPGYKPAGQALEQSGTRSYDVMTIKNASGQTQTVYFDITGFFGKNS